MSEGAAPLDRASAMVRRVMREARAAGIADGEAARIGSALRLAFEHRNARLPREGPGLLHPGRTILILLGDARERSPAVLAAAALFDSHEPEMEPPASEGRAVPADAFALAASVPTPARSGQSLVEDLLLAEARVLRLALAERLDHARHLHLRPPDEWAGVLASVEEVYLPLAERAEPVLGRRLRWWAATFARRWRDDPG